jgi:RimJ/RimL family protein N-acetyltransferase
VLAESLKTPAIKEVSMSKRNRLNSLIKQNGIWHSTWLVIRYILCKLIGLDWQGTILFERSLAEPIQEVIPKIKVSIKQATIDDLEKFKDIVDSEKYHRFQQRFKKGNICFMVLDGDKVVAFSWISFDNEYESESQIEVKLKDKEAYSFDTFVDPAYRNNRLYAAVIPARLKYLSTQGYEKVIGLVDDKNTYSLRAHASAGYRPKRTATLIKIFGLKFRHWKKYTGTL